MEGEAGNFLAVRNKKLVSRKKTSLMAILSAIFCVRITKNVWV
jgi:predicted dinucleotide-utilizing enzyme